MTFRSYVVLASLCSGFSIAAQPALAQAVETATVTKAAGERLVVLPGELVAFEAVNLTARVQGYVESIPVDRGDQVERGQLIATLVAPELAAQVAEAQARVQAATAKRVEAETQLATARTVYERLKAAAATPGAVSALELQSAEEAVKGVTALVDSNAKAVDAANASLDAVRVLQGYLRVVAPFAGRVTERFLHPGALVGPSTGPLIRLEQTSHLRLVVPVPERHYAAITRGRKLEFTVPALVARKFTGTVARVAGSLDAKTRTMAVELDIQNPDGVLAPGMFPDVSWPVEASSAALLVPATAVVTTTDRTFVIRVSGGKASWVTVKKGAAHGDLVEVTGALAAGDIIVKRASDEIRDGSAIK
jgi:RND family efflux transporter MFP subunit